MRLKQEFIVHNTDKESMLVPAGGAGFSGLVRGNKTFGAIIGLLDRDMTREELIDALKERFDAPEGMIEKDVDKALTELNKIGALQ